MAKKIILTGLLALALVLGMTVVGCNNGSTDDDNNPNPIKFESTDTAGNTYILIITPVKPDTIGAGNSYELTIKNGQTTQVSKGTITNVASNGALTMKPKNSGSDTFTVTVTNSGQMTNISGTITVGEGETVTLPDTPLTPGNSGGDGKVIIDGWSWYAYSDINEGGTSTITMTQGSGNDSKKLTFTGNVQKIPELTWGYAGCYVTPNSANLAALKNADSFSFKCRGDGKQYVVYVDTSDVPENSRFHKTFTASTTDNTITVQYSELMQGYDNTFNKNNIKGILFEAFLEINSEGRPFNITIWDLKVDGQGGNGEGDGGTFTLTGIPSEYDGKHATLLGWENDEMWTKGFALMGCNTINMSTGTCTHPVISNGSVSVPLWIMTSSTSVTRYSGNHTYKSVSVAITNLQSSTFPETFEDENNVASIEFSSVTFSNGSATRSWSQGNSSSGGGEGNASDFTYTETANAITITKYNGTGGSVTIPAQINGKPVTSIGNSAFNSCLSLTSVTIPNSVTSIGERAFYVCTSLTSITIPNSVTSIEDSTFYNCRSLTSVTIGNSVNSIGALAFSGCTSLTSVTIPDSVTSIGGDAFSDCTSITSITIPNSVTIIKSGAFSGCTSLTSITIPNSVTTIEIPNFANCTSLTAINVDAANTGLSSVDGVLYDYNKFLLAVYPKGKTASSFIIPNSVFRIAASAFSGCTNLTSITLPNSVTEIGRSAFSGCTGLTSVTFEKAGIDISDASFPSSSSLQTAYTAGDIGTYTRPNGTSTTWTKQSNSGGGEGGPFTSIEDMAKWLADQSANTPDKPYTVKLNVADLAGIGLPFAQNGTKYVNLDLSGSTFTTLDGDGLCEKTNLIGVILPNSLTSIGGNFFDGTGLTSVTIPSGLTDIGESVFIGCTSLTAINVTAGNSAYSSDNGILYNKDKTTLVKYPGGKTGSTFTIPNSVTTIGNSAFLRCSGLTSVTIPNSVTSIGGSAFSFCDRLASVTISNNVTSIGNFVFYSCTSLTSITIPNSVTSIGSAAFNSCTSLTSIIIPSSVNTIEYGVFGSCTSLTSVKFEGTIASSKFSSVNSFSGDLRAKFYATDKTNGTPGTYTTNAPASDTSVWTRK